MTNEAREAIFGQPSELLVQEAVYAFKRREGDWPLIEEAIDKVMELADCDKEAAEYRVMQAIHREQVQVVLRGRAKLWGLEVTQDVADAIWRRHRDMTMPRKDPAEFFIEEDA
jgi:hypothetical protein